MAAAITERPAPTSRELNSRSASAVAGNVNEKASTPSAAQPRLGTRFTVAILSKKFGGHR
jgi:hypothetical protein